MLVVFVELAKPLDATDYRKLAEKQVDQLGVPPQNPYSDVPLYEVHYRFRQGKSALATVYFRNESPTEGLQHLRTYVYPPSRRER